MGIYIKGMQMPESGAERCIVIRGDGSITTFVGAPIDYATAILVPDHGDLIDRDLIMEKMWDMETFADAVKWSPTVLPADREGEA